MASFNKVIMVGHLTKDPEIRYTASSMPICTFRLAVKNRFRSGDEWKEDVCYIDVVTFGRQAENVVACLNMGSMVLAEGRLNYREWQGENGEKRSKYEVVADKVEFLDRHRRDEVEPVSPHGSTQNLDDIPF